MTGDEIRGTKFARVFKGYQPDLVDSWMADVAACLDVGVPPATFMPPPRFPEWLRGYDIDAVDQILCALGSTVGRDRR